MCKIFRFIQISGEEDAVLTAEEWNATIGERRKEFIAITVCKISETDIKTKPHLYSRSFWETKLLSETDVFSFLSLADINRRCPLAKRRV